MRLSKGFRPLCLPPTLLLGPGPSNPSPRVLAAMGFNTVGHMNASFIRVMDEVQELLRYALQTDNKMTIGLTGSGAACMEATICNLLERGETVAVGCNGYWGDRLCAVASRQGVNTLRVEAPWGEVIPFETIVKTIEESKPQAIFLVHGESSTGVCQPLDKIGEVCRKNNCLLIVDTVVTLGGMAVFMDKWQVDAMYSGAQKCLGCPPGVSPISYGARAMEKIKTRKTPVQSFYLDMIELGKYWGDERIYHHTASINGVYALREALIQLSEEGLENSWKRHKDTAEVLWRGLEAMGLELLVKNPEQRLIPLTTIRVPKGIDAKAVQQYMMAHYNIEIAGGLGKLAGQVWRVGLMGYNSRVENVMVLLSTLQETLKHFKYSSL